MYEYVRLIEAENEYEANEFIENGWEVISAVKSKNGESEYIKYHLGLPAKVLLDKLMSIVKEYEKHGLKDVLFGKVAKKTNDRAENYAASKDGVSWTPLAKFMTEYDNTVNGSRLSYAKKRDDDLPSDVYFDH